MYHENSTTRSPGSQRHHQPQQLRRQTSRQFDAYGAMSTGLYDDHMARYDTSRLDRLNTGLHNNAYGYDLSGSQTWNVNGFGGAHALGIGSGAGTATGRMKQSTRGRSGLPSVSLISMCESVHLLFSRFVY